MSDDARMRQDSAQVTLEVLEGDMLAGGMREAGVVRAEEDCLVAIRSRPSSSYILDRRTTSLTRAACGAGMNFGRTSSASEVL